MAEGIQRRTTEITVGAIGHRIISKCGQIRRGTVERHREVAGRIDLTKENFAHSASSFLSRIPGLKNRRQMFVLPRQSDSRTTAIDKDHRFPCGLKFFDKSLLSLRQLDRIAVKSFAFLRWCQAADINNQICIRCLCEGFSIKFVQWAIRGVVLGAPGSSRSISSDWTSHCKGDFNVCAGQLSDAIQN